MFVFRSLTKVQLGWASAGDLRSAQIVMLAAQGCFVCAFALVAIIWPTALVAALPMLLGARALAGDFAFPL